MALSLLPTARAHTLVDSARRAFERAEFRAALDLSAQAEAADDLTRAELESLFATRAQVHLAMGSVAAMRADLRRLAAIDPEHAFSRRAPPDLRRAFTDVRATMSGPLRVRARPTVSAEGATIAAEVDNEIPGLVRRVRISGRPVDGPRWQVAEDGPLLLLADDAQIVEYFVEVVGVGGVVIASAGTTDEPLRLSLAPSLSADSADDEEDWGVWAAVVALCLIAAGAAVAIPVAVVVSEATGETPLSPFTVRW